MRALLFLAVLALLSLHPVRHGVEQRVWTRVTAQGTEPSLGQLPPPPVVGMRGTTQAPAAESEADVGDESIVRQVVEQGGLALVALVIAYFYRRDFLSKSQDTAEQAAQDRAEAAEERRAFIALVEKNTTALVELRAELRHRSDR